jgi:glycosyltransferase involved in cell wall biosynthesis
VKDINKNNPIKVINVLSRMNIGGPTIHAVLLTKYLENEKFHSFLISGSLSQGEGDMSYLVDDYTIEHRSIKSLRREISLVDDIKAIKELYKIFRSEKPQIVHTNLAKAGMVARLAAWLARVPVILHTYHGHVFSGYFSPRKTFVYILIERLMALVSTQIVVISEMIKKDICVVYKIVSEKKVSIIPLGFELTKMESVNNYRGTFRKQFSIPNGVPIIAIVGRLTAIKNHQLFVDIANLLVQKKKQIHFLIIGDGEMRGQMEQKVEALGIVENVHFTGWVTETAKMYADVDIMLLTSKNEGTPVTVIEAMYYTIPVVSSNVGGLSDLIDNGKTGFLINSLVAEDYIEVILKLLASDQDRHNIGKAGHIFIADHFNIDQLITNMDDLYTKLLKKKGIVW